jgi:predicted ATPase/DNA-binding SARP family transcriptional activator
MSSDLEFQVLGPLRVRRNGSTVDVRSPTQRVVLCALLVQANLPVPNDVLLEAVWDGDAPRRPEDTLRVHVSQLRRALGRTPIETTSRGYMLRIDPGSLDSHAFDEDVRWATALLRDGEHSAAYERLRAALDRWRGEPYEDVRYRDFAQPEIRRLEELRIDALEHRAEAALELGLHDEVVAELSELVDSHPHRERLWEQLMLAFYRSGRQAEALAAFRDAHRGLADELGLEPGPELRRLERAILTHDPALEPGRAGGVHLPAPLTTFVGRDRELDELTEILGRARLVTLVGAGGSGKTRLALEAARTAAPGFPDGVWFVDLAPLPAGESPADSILAALGRPGRERADPGTIAAALGDTRALLLLDNCEHVREPSAELVAELLTRCAGLTVLATSRERLHVMGETVQRVPPLGLPTEPTGDAVARSDAVRLFLARARDVEPGLELDDDTRGPIAEIVRLAAGIPLAIELAAARLEGLPLAEVVAQVEGAFGVKQEPSHVSIPRHRTLRAALDWSRSLLDPSAEDVFRYLWVFRGGWTLESLAAVCPDRDGTALLEPLLQLVEASVVQAVRRGPDVRYSLLEPIRQYARSTVDDERWAAALCDRHAERFGELATAIAPDVRRGEIGARQVLEAEEANMMAALAWRLDRHLADDAAALAGALCTYWGFTGRPDRALTWAGRVLAQATAISPDRLADVVDGALWNAGLSGDFGRTDLVAAAEDAVHLTADPERKAALLNQLGNFKGLRGDVRGAVRSFAASRRLLRRHGFAERARTPAVNAACGCAWMGRPSFADRLTTAVCKETSPTESAHNIARAVRGLTAVYASSPREAAAELDEALLGLDAYSTRFHHAAATVWRGVAALALGDLPRAAELAAEALRLADRPRALAVGLFAHELAAWTALERGDLDGVRMEIEEIVQTSRRSGSTGSVVRVLDLIGLVEHRVGADDRATILLAAATLARERLGLARTPLERERESAAQTELLGRLGRTRYEELAEQGAALTLDGAVELAFAGSALPV